MQIYTRVGRSSPAYSLALNNLAVRIDHGATRAEAEQRFLTAKQPTGRFIGAEGVAALVAFLCGPDAADITGAALPVDGGWSAA